MILVQQGQDLDRTNRGGVSRLSLACMELPSTSRNATSVPPDVEDWLGEAARLDGFWS